MSLTFSLGPCPVRVGFSWLALLTFCCLFGGEAGSAFSLLAMLLHEAAHLGVMVLLGSPPRRVELTALGCDLVLDAARPLPPARQALVSLAGPAGNLLCWGCCALLGLREHPFAWVSLALGLFHLLPAEPLDGGLAIRAACTARLGPARARRVSRVLTVATVLPLGALGFLVLLRTRYNFTLLALAVYLMLYLVLREDRFL